MTSTSTTGRAGRVVLTTLGLALCAGPVFAKGNQTHTKSQPQATSTKLAKAAAKDELKVSKDAFKLLHQVRTARLAIFDGKTKVAKDAMSHAVKDAAATVKDADRLAIALKEPRVKGDQYVAFDARLSIADGFVPTPEKRAAIGKAVEHLKKGDKNKALHLLKLANIDIAYSAALIPVNSTKKLIDKAAQLIQDGKYYQGNLALKSVEDSVVYDTFAEDWTPICKPGKCKQGTCKKGKQACKTCTKKEPAAK